MAIPFSGQFTSPATPEQAFDFLADPNSFAPLLPDFESMTQEDATHFTVRLNVGVANLKGTTAINMELREATRPQRVFYVGKGNAFGNQITTEIGFDLSPAPESTLVAWRGQADVVGKLALLAGSMLEPLAGKGMSKLMDGLKSTLAQRVAGGSPKEKQAERASEEDQTLSPTAESSTEETSRSTAPAAESDDDSEPSQRE